MKIAPGKRPSASREQVREKLKQALSRFDSGPLRDGAEELLNTLGYRSERTTDAGSVDEFLDTFDAAAKQREALGAWRGVEIVFQVTSDEIAAQENFFGQTEFEKGWNKSFLFLAVDLHDGSYNRTTLADMTRAVNRLFGMPVILLFRDTPTMTLSVIHRRAHKRDDRRAVLEKVTLIKDVDLEDPHRAHIDILVDLSLEDLKTKERIRDFDDLHDAWKRTLDVEKLNKQFYDDLFEWFERASGECRFPNDGAGAGGNERHVIRLITRLLFIWFLKEKGLVPGDLFEQEFAEDALKNHGPDGTDYYRAVLQNLFFATLNTAIDKRAFSTKNNHTHRDFNKYRYHERLTDPDGFLDKLKTVPFVNGGLFDCLDDFEGVKRGGRRIDAFTDNEAQGRDLDVPARLFFDTDKGLFPLFRSYKFTVEENTPLDQEVALDPELLGRAFENLLAAYNPETRETARKSTGSYYTPRQVVDYMVHEALTEALAAKTEPADGDVTFWRERLLYLLDHSDAMDDADELFEEDDKRVIVAAIADVKALDPAVGSGAFPMGILQTLTLALRRIDPDNALWEKFQKERAKARAGEAFDTRDQKQRDEVLREISNTFEKYRQSDFGRKLYLIQNSIYGVDIQPIACQIAKLRFFVSLAIEQDPNPGARNLGIKPLPNLKTHFVAADTLITLQAETVSLLLDDAASSKRKEVAAVRERYFLADSRRKKLECVFAEQRLRDELRDILENERQEWVAAQERDIERKAEGLPNPDVRKKFRKNELCKLAKRQLEHDDILADARSVAEWDPYDQNGCANWFGSEYMFGVQGGFDVVIGNPPYIQLEKNQGELAKRYKDAAYETFARKGDIYQLFYERGCGLLKPDTGTLAYITSNSWLKAQYGKLLRRWFGKNHTLLRLIEMGKDVFEAIVDTGILLVREGGSAARVPAVDMDRLAGGAFPPPKKHWGEVRLNGESPWSILSPAEWRILEKMNARGTSLKNWDVRINYGIKTGYNAAFLIDDATRSALVAEDPRSNEIIKPVLRGRDIRRWAAKWEKLWLIVAKFGSHKFLAEHYPAVYRHLAQHETALRARGQCRYARSGRSQNPDYDGQHHWLELDNNPKDDYLSLFAKEKLFWIELADRGRFSYDDSGLFGEATTFVLTGEYLKFLCAVLNAELIHWFLRHTAPTSGMGTLRWKKVYVEIIPIPKIPPEAQRPFVDLASRIIVAKDADPDADTAAEEKEINSLVYALYGLTGTEIAAVEKSRP